jgi:hypothetical protein
MPALNGFLSAAGSAAGPDLILSPGKELYHYTSLPGLLGIIESRSLWLTHTLYLNDEEEMAHGDHVAAEAVAAALAGSATDAKKSAYLNQLNALLGRPTNEGVYICCFCQRDNLLSQWRGYGANGAGVSLQFDSAGFAQWTGADCPHGLMRFWKVFYKVETQRRIVDTAIAYSWNPYIDPVLCAQRAADAIQFFIPTFKNPGFEEEAEWRLIFTPNPICPIQPRFRVRGAMLVPYYPLGDLAQPPAPAPAAVPPQLPIGHVTVGPGAAKALNVESVRMLLSSYGYTGIPIEASDTPFRG